MTRILNQKIWTFLLILPFLKSKNHQNTRQRRFGKAFFHIILRPSTYYPGDHFNRGKNAVWLGVEWVHEPQTSAAITGLAKALKEHQIAYVFVFTSYLKDHGSFNPTYRYADQFVQELKSAYPEVKVLAR